MLVYTVADYHERFNLFLREINFSTIFFEKFRVGVLVLESLKSLNLSPDIGLDDEVNINELYPYGSIPEGKLTKRYLIQEDFR